MHKVCDEILTQLELSGKIKRSSFEFPPKIERTRNLSDMLEDVVDEKFYINNEKAEKLISQLKELKPQTLTANYRRVEKQDTEIAGTLVSTELVSLPGNFGGTNCVLDVGYLEYEKSKKQHQSNTVYSSLGLVPTLTRCDYKSPIKIGSTILIGGEQANQSVKTDGISTCLTSSMGTGGGYVPMVTETRPCLTPDRVEKRQNGRRFKEDGEDMFTLTSQDRHGVLQVGNIVDTGNWDNPQRGRIYSADGCSPSINCVGGGGLEPKILETNAAGLRTFGDNICGNKRVLEDWSQHERAIIDSDGLCCGHKTGQSDNFGYRKPLLETARTITANKHDSAVVKDYRIRKLTPKECWRLMGFSDEVFHLAEQVNSNSQLYKQAGNSIVVDVLVGIIEQIQIAKSRWLEELLEGV